MSKKIAKKRSDEWPKENLWLTFAGIVFISLCCAGVALFSYMDKKGKFCNQDDVQKQIEHLYQICQDPNVSIDIVSYKDTIQHSDRFIHLDDKMVKLELQKAIVDNCFLITDGTAMLQYHTNLLISFRTKKDRLFIEAYCNPYSIRNVKEDCADIVFYDRSRNIDLVSLYMRSQKNNDVVSNYIGTQGIHSMGPCYQVRNMKLYHFIKKYIDNR